MQISSHANLEIGVNWNSPHAAHCDRQFFPKVNLWRDVFPGTLGEQVRKNLNGVQHFRAGDALPLRDERNVMCLPLHRLDNVVKGHSVRFRSGRFYPKGLIAALSGTYPQDRHPFRYLGDENGVGVVDLNHPLLSAELTMEAKVVDKLDTKEERGGRCNDVLQDICEGGIGLQASLPQRDTDFFSDDPFNRQDHAEDERFYRQPRFVNHLDEKAMSQVSEIYAEHLRPGMHVLDLMSSWNSHLPADLGEVKVTGLGMNREELAANPRLSDVVVSDLNRLPKLPFADATFDAAICTVSVEYLISPFEVFREVARVLKPGAPFVVTFSERWFPPKVVKIWIELHPFERMGLVLEYFRRSEGFASLHTESIRGHLRPANDKYASMMPLADPVYAVWGKVGTA